MSEVTKLLPVTAKFDGCFCHENCLYKTMFRDVLGYMYMGCIIFPRKKDYDTDIRTQSELGQVFTDYKQPDGSIVFKCGRDTKLLVDTDKLLYSYIRTRDCCREFGMGDEDE